MNGQSEATPDRTRRRFQFTIVNYFELAIAASCFFAVDTRFFDGYLILWLAFIVAKSIIALVWSKRKLPAIAVYLSLSAAFLLCLSQNEGVFDWDRAKVLYIVCALVPTVTFVLDLHYSPVRPRTLIWRPITECGLTGAWFVIFAYFDVAFNSS